MTIQEKIKSDMVQAMKDKDSVKVNVLRGLISAFTNELVAKKLKPDEGLPDQDATAVIMRAVKQRKDSIEQFKAGGREDLVEAENIELKIVEQYAPKLMSRDEIRKIAEGIKEKLNITDKSKMGMLMGSLMKELKGQADGGDVKAVVEEILG